MAVIACLVLLFFCQISASIANDRLVSVNARHSYSLTTFDTDGKLTQVERASRAALLGTPVVAFCFNTTIYFSAPQAFPSPFIVDDGTSRFAKVSDTIIVSHTGIAADGRIAIAAAQRCAISHEYTYDESMPIEAFLEEMSLFFQEYTMKAGVRPFGCALIVGSLEGNQLYRLDPSGAVETLGAFGVIGSMSSKLQDSMEKIRDRFENSEGKQEHVQAALSEALVKAINEVSSDKKAKVQTVLTACFSKEKFSVYRVNTTTSDE
mmetsp:Transcript_11351/g.16677  ORF Transcript_11351/g.16677 Transcript_11351/m.16677 type:complete len:264 (+) Transcript_11351:51-842(+)